MPLPREEEHSLFAKLDWKEALALVGPRRAGKSTLAQRLLEAWRERGGAGDYQDFEALGAPSSPGQLAEWLSLIPKGGLAVLDEVQELEGWVRVVRQEIERAQHHVLVTGSSASLLSKEVASALGGRAIPETILPLSYRDARAWGLRTLTQYLSTGGYPECVLRPSDAPQLHRLYLQLAVLRDVAARQKVRQVKPLTDLALLLLSEPGKRVSARKTAAALGISQPTFRAFVQGLNDAFLVLSVPPYLHSPRQRIVADAKHYAYDPGLQKSVSIAASEDEGRRFENLIAIELVRRGYTLSYIATPKGECDFIAQKPGTQTIAIQVYTGEEDPPEREENGLRAGMAASGGVGLFLTTGGRLPQNRLPTGARQLEIEEWLLENPSGH